MPLTTVPYFLAEGATYRLTRAEWLANTTIIPEGTICIDTDGGIYGVKIGDGSHTWSNLEHIYNNSSTIPAPVETGTVLADTDTITMSGTLQDGCQLLLFLGTTKQPHTALITPTSTTIKLPQKVLENTPYEIIKLRANGRSGHNKSQKYNYIIDGEFDVWYEGASQTTSGYGSDTMWSNINDGSTKTHSRQSFAVGELFPDGVPCPKYYSRTVVTSVAGANNRALKLQRIEDVSKLAGKTVNFSFYAKANASKNICIEFIQVFGTGGTPSANIVGISTTIVTLSTSWAKYDITVSLPSIEDKILGTNNDSSLTIVFWFDAGSTFSNRASNLGQQSGTFDLAKVSLVEGDSSIFPIDKSIGETLREVKRYYQRFGSGSLSGERIGLWVRANGTNCEVSLPMIIPMRSKLPTLIGTGVTNLQVWSGVAAAAVSSLAFAGADCTKCQAVLNVITTAALGSGQGGMMYTPTAGAANIVLDARM